LSIGRLCIRAKAHLRTRRLRSKAAPSSRDAAVFVGFSIMKTISSLSLEKHEGPYQKWPGSSRLYFNGMDTSKTVPGYVIEAQYQCEDGYLVITSYDCPHEESNDFVLLDDNFDVIAQNGLMVLYGSYLIENHWPISEKGLRLHYYNELFYDLLIEDAPKICSQALRSARGALSRLWRKGIEPREAVPLRKALRVVRFEQFRDDPKCVESLADLYERLKQTSECHNPLNIGK
jgi:hypothetical protein